VTLMIVSPVILLIVFGYAANFKVDDIPTVVVGPGAHQAAALLRAPTFTVTETDPAAGESAAQARLREGKAVIAVVTGGSPPPLVLMEGTQLFSVETAQGAPGKMASATGMPSPQVRILFNPDLTTSPAPAGG
jgi:ABC-2 type transport system permease protein